MTRLLTEADKATVSEAIKQAERRTTGELITVIAPASDDYWFIPSLWASLIALMVPVIVLLVGTWWDTTTLFTLQIGVFLVLVTTQRVISRKWKLLA